MRNSALVLLLAAAPLVAQHSYTANDIEDGAKTYQSNCSRCHGPEGNLVPGVDFVRGKFLSVKSDDDLTRIIRNGIPGTPMPAATFPNFMTFPLIAYLRTMGETGKSTLPPGDAAHGRQLFDGKGQCLSCHRVGMHGSRLGPNLSDIGGLRRQVQLERALLEPGKAPSPEYRKVRVVTQSGAEYTGRLLNLDTFTVQMLDSSEHLRTFEKSELRELSLITNAGMPSYKDKLTTQEAADVVAYLVSLKGAH
ncbi:MAG TPA: c-type cytochrome [Bryobacteraceae bacterium]|nr:c-type cytochrome [Bryobacteraceae bacterium]